MYVCMQQECFVNATILACNTNYDRDRLLEDVFRQRFGSILMPEGVSQCYFRPNNNFLQSCRNDFVMPKGKDESEYFSSTARATNAEILLGSETSCGFLWHETFL